MIEPAERVRSGLECYATADKAKIADSDLIWDYFAGRKKEMPGFLRT